MEYLFEGSISVKAVVNGARRSISEIIIDTQKRDRDTAYILGRAKAEGIKVTRRPRDQIDDLCAGHTHGGIVCRAGERRNDTLAELGNGRFLCLLEGIEDPFNFGYCVRSLMAAGCDGIIVGERNWYASAAVVARSSAGASELMPAHISNDLPGELNRLKERFSILCAMRRDAVSIYAQDLRQPLILAIGGEKRGLSKGVLDVCDKNVYIPYDGKFRNALNASSAVSVIAFEILRQRLEGESL